MIFIHYQTFQSAFDGQNSPTLSFHVETLVIKLLFVEAMTIRPKPSRETIEDTKTPTKPTIAKQNEQIFQTPSTGEETSNSY